MRKLVSRNCEHGVWTKKVEAVKRGREEHRRGEEGNTHLDLSQGGRDSRFLTTTFQDGIRTKINDVVASKSVCPSDGKLAGDTYVPPYSTSYQGTYLLSRYDTYIMFPIVSYYLLLLSARL